MALEDLQEGLTWGGYETLINDIVTTWDSSTAIIDYSGKSNTEKIIEQLGDGNAPVTEACVAYTFPNGSAGYLGAAGEWKAVLNNESTISSDLSVCGGTSMSSDYWTSTQASDVFVWIADISRALFSCDVYKNQSDFYARAFAPYVETPNIISFVVAYPSGSSETCQCIEGTTWYRFANSAFDTITASCSGDSKKVYIGNGLYLEDIVGSDVIEANKVYEPISATPV